MRSQARACGREGKTHKLTGSDKIVQIVTNRWLGLPIFVIVMFAVYYLSITTVGTMMTDWVNDVLFGEIIPPTVEGWLAAAATPAWLNSLILDGIIAGVGAVLGFVPQMMVPVPGIPGGLWVHGAYRLPDGPYLPPLRPVR